VRFNVLWDRDGLDEQEMCFGFGSPETIFVSQPRHTARLYPFSADGSGP